MKNELMIRTEKLTKDYGRFRAVDGLNLQVKAGEIFGFLGPNGAGKTTTIKMLMGIIKPTAGEIWIGGYNLEKEPEQAKAITGFIPDRPFLYEKLTGEEFLEFVAGLYKMDIREAHRRMPDLFEFFELRDWSRELIENYSHGMKQRLAFAGALLHKPKVIIVDEPMVGLDPKGARLIKETFRRLAKQGCAILMSTHTLEIAEEVCDTIGIIQAGKMIAVGTMDDLRKQAKAEDDGRLENIFLTLTGGESIAPVIQLLKM
jgi:ABC-2 type transport system ATP-binding protein